MFSFSVSVGNATLGWLVVLRSCTQARLDSNQAPLSVFVDAGSFSLWAAEMEMLVRIPFHLGTEFSRVSLLERLLDSPPSL